MIIDPRRRLWMSSALAFAVVGTVTNVAPYSSLAGQESTTPAATAPVPQTAPAVVAPAPAPANPARAWHEPYVARGTLGADLEPFFQDVLANCNVHDLSASHWWQHHRPRSAIPQELQERLPLEQPFAAVVSTAGFNLWRFIFFQPDVSEYDPLNPARSLTMAVAGALQQPLPLVGVPTADHIEDCTSIVREAADFELNPPLVALKSAISATNTGSRHLALVAGTFQSPFATLSDAAAPEGARRLAWLSTWLAYDNDPTLVNKSPSYLAAFSGAALIDLGTAHTEQTLSADAQAGGATLVFDAKGSLQLQSSLTTGTTMQDYRVYIFSPDYPACKPSRSCAKFAPLLTPTQIEAALRAAPIHVDEQGALIPVGSTAPVDFSASVAGIPSELCSPTRWAIDHQPANGTITPLSITQSSHRELCQFSFELTPSAGSVTADSPLHTAFALRLQTSSGVAPAPALYFEGTFNPTDEPSPIVGSFRADPVDNAAHGTNQKQFHWTIPVYFRDEQVPADYTRAPLASKPVLTCGGQAEPITVGTMAPGNRRFDLSVDRTLTHGEEVKDSADFVACTLDVDVVLTTVSPPHAIAHAGSVTRHVQVNNLLMPRITIAASAAAPAPPGAPPAPPAVTPKAVSHTLTPG